MQFDQQQSPILTVPYGATSGPRIVVDGVNGVIVVYDALGNPAESISPVAIAPSVTYPNGLDAGFASYNDSGALVAQLGSSGLSVLSGTQGVEIIASLLGLVQQNFVTGLSFEGSPAAIQVQEVGGGGTGTLGWALFSAATTTGNSEQTSVQVSSPSQDGTVRAYGQLSYFSAAGSEFDYVKWTNTGANVTGTITGIQPGSNPAVADTWHNFPFNTNWSNSPGKPVQYIRMGDGTALIKGWPAFSGTLSSGAIIGTLPTGYRPPSQIHLEMVPIAFAAPATVQCQIDTSGNVQLFFGASIASPTFALDGFRFPLF